MRAVGLGVAAGFVGGLFGVGGGIVVVPGLVLLLSLDQHRAHATSLAAIVASAAAAMTPFAISGDVRWGDAAGVFAGAAFGAYVAARAVARIPALWLARGFVALTFVAAARLAIWA